MRAVLAALGLVSGLAATAAAAWYASLPVLDPTGQQDSAPALRAMSARKAVRNAASGWPVTETGWPFFERYGAAETKP
jgi:hypothetical protein